MTFYLPAISLLISIILGAIVTKKITIEIPKFSYLFFIITLGIILFTSINYFSSLIFSFPKGIIIGQTGIVIFEVFYLIRNKSRFNIILSLAALFREKLLVVCIILISIPLVIIFHTHILQNINSDLYTGESTYGDLPFHLSTISQIAYGFKLPPENPMYAKLPLAYPYLINFFSAILVYEGWSLRLSIIIPGLILSVSLIGLVYDFAFSLTKNSLKSFLTVLFYFLNGGLGFYFFLKDHAFNFISILQALSHPTLLKEYSHLVEQNIQWVNIVSRMIAPERSLLFGIPAGIVILRLLIFRNTDKYPGIFDLIISALLISLMPLLHTHTALAMIVILPVLGLLTLSRQHWKNQLTNYFLVAVLAIIFAAPFIPLFFSHISQSEGFFKPHMWWMAKSNENVAWFWFKNTYLFIPISLIVLISPFITTKKVRILQLSALILLLIINLALFSPYDWDNVKFLFWGGLFFALGAASLFGYLLKTKYLSITIVFIIITMVSSALLSIWREINVKYILFSKEAAAIGEQLKIITSPNDIFLTYKIHNSPVNNLAGRSIIMGYPGMLWVHGINYQKREQDINDIFAGSANAQMLIEKYGIDYITIESYNPGGMFINRIFLNQYPVVLKTANYTIYETK